LFGGAEGPASTSSSVSSTAAALPLLFACPFAVSFAAL